MNIRYTIRFSKKMLYKIKREKHNSDRESNSDPIFYPRLEH